jgi:hypothetical protein
MPAHVPATIRAAAVRYNSFETAVMTFADAIPATVAMSSGLRAGESDAVPQRA